MSLHQATHGGEFFHQWRAAIDLTALQRAIYVPFFMRVCPVVRPFLLSKLKIQNSK
jgi:hypothetical protein